MRAFLAPMEQLGEFEEIGRKIAGNRGMIQITGCIDSQKPHFIYCAGENCGNRARIPAISGKINRIIIAHNDLRAKEIYEN